MKKPKTIFILLSIFFVSQNIGANNSADSVIPVKIKPKFIYKFENLTYFDNRIFHLPYHQPKMYFGDRLTALAGIGLNKEGEHKLYAGLTAIVPFGTAFKDYKFLPMVYYKYQQEFKKHNLKLHLGIVPYREMELTFPAFIRKGSAEYSMPNLQGALVQYNFNHKLLLEYAVDWRKVKTKTERDNYGMILAVTWKQWFVTDKNNGTMNNLMDIGLIAERNRLGHNLDTIKNNVDNIVINPFVKADFGKLTKNFKTIFLQIGYLGSFNNDNINIKNQWNNSIVVDCGIQWKMISLKNSLYVSLNQEKDGNLMPLHKYYPELYISDQFYRAPLYNITRIDFDLLNIKSIFALKAQFLMHIVPDYKIGWQQKITASVKF